MTETTKETILSDDEIKKNNDRFNELVSKSENERSEEEKTELEELKTNYGKRVQERIKKEIAEKWVFKTEAEKKEIELQRLREENEVLKKGKETFSELPKETYIEINGKKWLTDEALLSKIQMGEITEQEGYKYQRKRDTEETIVRVKEDLKKEEGVRQENITRLQDAQKVISEYPNFAKFLSTGSPNPAFNPNDPLYKMTNEIYLEGYAGIPDGLSKALRRAKQILRVSDTNIDRTGDLNIENITLPPENQRREQEITLTEDEKEAAVKMFTRGDVMNPKTRRPYTVQEAHLTALEAKKMRQRKI